MDSRTAHTRPALDIRAVRRLLDELTLPTPGASPRRAPGESAEDLPRIPGYVLDRQVGAGGGGAVYRGFREGSDRPLAIKVLRFGHTLQTLRGQENRRAWRELDLASQLRLPCVPRLIDYGFAGGHLFVASEFIDGLPLDRFADEARLDRRKRVELLIRVADAVQSLHEHGVLHRDLKPSNILVDRHGEPSIIDLGIAVLADSSADSTLSLEGNPIGTPAFMSPEQARGDRTQISTRSDVYSLGATGLLLLTGDPPHRVHLLPPHAAVARVAREPVAAPRAIDPTLPRGLAAVLAKSLSFNPMDRYASAAEFKRDLERWLLGEPVSAGSPRVLDALRRGLARHPMLAGAGLAAAFGLVAAGAAALGAYASMASGIGSISVTADWSTVTAYSSLGFRVHEWPTGEAGGVLLASAVDRPEELGGGRVLVMALRRSSAGEATRTEMTVYDCADPHRPAWSLPLSGASIRAPDSLRPAPTDTYRIRQALLRDVFPGPAHPGLEIVILAHERNRSASVIYVCNLRGDVLDRRWHDGQLSSLAWMEEPRRLALSGVSNRCTVADLGYTAPPEVRSPNIRPYVCIAFDPVAAQLARPAAATAAEMLAPGHGVAWYRRLEPPGLVDHFSIPAFGAPPSGLDPRRHATLIMHALNEDGWPISTKAVYVSLDERGGIADIRENDSFAADPDKRGLQDFKLVDWPARASE